MMAKKFTLTATLPDGSVITRTSSNAYGYVVTSFQEVSYNWVMDEKKGHRVAVEYSNPHWDRVSARWTTRIDLAEDEKAKLEKAGLKVAIVPVEKQ